MRAGVRGTWGGDDQVLETLPLSSGAQGAGRGYDPVHGPQGLLGMAAKPPVPSQAVPPPESLPDAPLPPPDATPTLGHRGVLPAPVNRDALLHLLLSGGTAGPPGQPRAPRLRRHRRRPPSGWRGEVGAPLRPPGPHPLPIPQSCPPCPPLPPQADPSLSTHFSTDMSVLRSRARSVHCGDQGASAPLRPPVAVPTVSIPMQSRQPLEATRELPPLHDPRES